MAEVNANPIRGYLVDGIDADPQLDFWRQLAWKIVDKKLEEETEAGGADGRRLITRRGTLGDHEIVTASKYCGNGLLMRINGGGSSCPTRSKYATTEAVIVFFKQGGIAYAIRFSSYVLSVVQIMFLMLIPKE